jgi:hypothetical protein
MLSRISLEIGDPIARARIIRHLGMIGAKASVQRRRIRSIGHRRHPSRRSG